jgi:hypothetical protein
MCEKRCVWLQCHGAHGGVTVSVGVPSGPRYTECIVAPKLRILRAPNVVTQQISKRVQDTHITSTAKQGH